MTTEQAHKIELARMLYNFTQTVRRQKRRPELAAVAATKEMEFKQDLDRLEAEAGQDGEQQAA